MIVYKDILSGDEMLSSAFPLMEVKDADGNVVSISTGDSSFTPVGGHSVSEFLSYFSIVLFPSCCE